MAGGRRPLGILPLDPRGVRGQAAVHVQPLLDHQGPVGDPRHLPRRPRPDRQHAAAAGHVSRLLGAYSARCRRRTRDGDGALGHAVAPVRPQGQDHRSGRHQRPQRPLAALAALARRREPLHRPVHVLLGSTRPAPTAKRSPSGLRSTKAVPWRRSPVSGRLGRRCEQPRRARSRATSLPS